MENGVWWFYKEGCFFYMRYIISRVGPMDTLRPSQFFISVMVVCSFDSMNPPSYPLIKMDDMEREELYVNLVRQTKRILKEK